MIQQETSSSLVSYGVGIGSITIAQTIDTAHSLTIIFGCLIVSIRLIHDAVRLYRYLKKKNGEE